MKLFLTFLVVFSSLNIYATEKLKFNFENEELTAILKVYSQASGRQFIIDSTVRGKVTLLNPTEINLEDAYSQLSEALAINGFAIVKQNDWLTVRNARSAQRDNIKVTQELPVAKPMRLETWVINLKHVAAIEIQRETRMITSSYGEMAINSHNNQLIITDWTTNLQRVSELIKQIDIPAPAGISKLVVINKSQMDHEKTTKTESTDK